MTDGPPRRRDVLRAVPATILGLAGTGVTQATTGVASAATVQTTDATAGRTASFQSSVTHTAKLVPSDGGHGDRFGRDVAIAGWTALITAPFDTGQNEEYSGSVYVFRRSDGSWSQQTKLTGAESNIRETLATTPALSGDGQSALIGANTGEDGTEDTGVTAYWYTRAGGSWTQEATLTRRDANGRGASPRSVFLATDGQTALVAVSRNKPPSDEIPAAVYVFTRSTETWTQQAKLTPSDGDPDDGFGSAAVLAGDGSTALVGARRDADPNGKLAGSAYVFTRHNGWARQDKLTPRDGDTYDWFGRSAALSRDGSTALIGATQSQNADGTPTGAAYVFTRDEGSWTQQAKLTPSDGEEYDYFGWSVALTGNGQTALISAVDDDPSATDEIPGGVGSAYIFVRSDGTWTQQATLDPYEDDDTVTDPMFGSAVALTSDGKRALIGARAEDTVNGDLAGSAHVFERNVTESVGDSSERDGDSDGRGETDDDNEPEIVTTSRNTTDTQAGGRRTDTTTDTNESGAGFGLLTALGGLGLGAYRYYKRGDQE